ncbi:MAG TPA: hypothetical protein PLU95_03740 [Syntrophales bacterium]|nr:hypothetical protein [Syntrophales bacterium]HPN08392.1 hypothetical protein [Syntrophales bacterium]HPX80927.1 hypothetical protein [Syntrophales bacterium]HQB13343.1 hypothetical protein [Syntrophales bacterium]HQK80255.1 hypothetical protein [Syntrophales bacterium]
MSDISIIYTFEIPGGGKVTYPITLDAKTISLITRDERTPASWTELDNCRCSICPLTPDDHPHCPIAVNISRLVEYFQDVRSTDVMKITVTTKERSYFKEAPAQRGLASILGIIMPTSGCPVMNFLKPMARFHLPFSTSSETIIRSTSIYMLSQYFVAKRGGKPDIALEKLNRAYSDVQQVNEGICNRIVKVVKNKDAEATSNAIVILDTFSQLLGMEIDDKLDSLAYLFETGGFVERRHKSEHQ